MSIDAGAQVANYFTHFYSYVDPVWSLLKIWDRLYLGRAPRTKETLPHFHVWCQVTRHP